jgi:hypothetical protein
LMTLDVEEKNFDSIITDKIVPAITKYQSRFVNAEDPV